MVDDRLPNWKLCAQREISRKYLQASGKVLIPCDGEKAGLARNLIPPRRGSRFSIIIIRIDMMDSISSCPSNAGYC